MKLIFAILVGALFASGGLEAASARSNDQCDQFKGRDRSRCLMKERNNRRNDNTQTEADTRQIETAAVPRPNPPRGTIPGTSSSPGAAVDGNRVTISWSSVAGATEYDFGIRDMTTNDFLVDTKTGATSYTARIEKGRIYRWNVRACNSAGCSAFTPSLYFQTASENVGGRATPTGIGQISLPAKFPVYNQHDIGNTRLYASSEWAGGEDPAGGPRSNYTCLAAVYAMIEHARGNSRFRVGPDSWNDQIGALGINGIGGTEPIGETERLLAQFRRGNPVILWGPLQNNSFGHFVLAIGTDSEGQIIVLDPSGGKRVTVNPITWEVSGGSVLGRVQKYRTVQF